MSEFTQDDFEVNIALKMKAIQAGQDYVTDCNRIGMKTVEKFIVIAKSNAGANDRNEKQWKETYLQENIQAYLPPTGSLRSARGSQYGSSVSVTRSSSRASSVGSGYGPYRPRILEQPMDDEPSYQIPAPTSSLAPAPAPTPDKLDEIMRMMITTAEQQKELISRWTSSKPRRSSKSIVIVVVLSMDF